jgi:hypothetical protein
MGGYGGNPTGVKGLYNLDRTWIRGQVYQIGTGQKKKSKKSRVQVRNRYGGWQKKYRFLSWVGVRVASRNLQPLCV